MNAIKFRIKNEYGKYLDKILYGIDLDDYICQLSDDEVYDREGNFYFNNSCLEGRSLLNKNTKDYYIVGLKLSLMNLNSVEEFEINDYDDFINSKCVLMIKIVDSEFVEVYSSKSYLLEKILENATKNNFDNINIIS